MTAERERLLICLSSTSFRFLVVLVDQAWKLAVKGTYARLTKNLIIIWKRSYHRLAIAFRHPSWIHLISFAFVLASNRIPVGTISDNSIDRFHIIPHDRFIKGLMDSLNAEIALGTVTNVTEGVQWIGYTYLFVRMRKNPFAYGA